MRPIGGPLTVDGDHREQADEQCGPRSRASEVSLDAAHRAQCPYWPTPPCETCRFSGINHVVFFGEMTMPVTFRCTSCGKAFSVSSQWAGKRIRCKACGNVMTVPGPAAFAAKPPPEPQPARAAQPSWDDLADLESTFATADSDPSPERFSPAPVSRHKSPFPAWQLTGSQRHADSG